MHHALPLTIAVLVSVGIIIIGVFYIAAPKHISKGFGLNLPASDAVTLAWLRLKGIRDIASGMVVLTSCSRQMREA